jgi:zinc/manganese transport system substrate-binding protein
MQRVLPLLLVVALVAVACGSGDEPAADDVVVVATTTVLGDIVSNIVGDAATVAVLLPIGADPHEFRASAQQVALMESSVLVVANGLGLEPGLEDVLESLESDGQSVLWVGERLSTLRRVDDGPADPHVWMDPLQMVEATTAIVAELDRILPDGGWGDRGEDYVTDLVALDLEIAELLGVSSGGDDRVLVTNHDSLGYFAARYRLEVVGVVVQGGSTLAEPSSSDLADLVATLRQTGITTIFAETTEPTALVESVAAEVGDVAVVELFIGSLGGPGSGAETYIEMLRTDATLIAAGLA